MTPLERELSTRSVLISLNSEYFFKKIFVPARHPFVGGVDHPRNDELKAPWEPVRWIAK
jgi:hypothetical protein